ncbi:hypothetical protein [Microbacterium sp. SORGH_AS_0862]|uniref:hypothetical protein n=1 Tax=Microbacterium sp. SORGH_AS_0862 TaxID=3041789 RepID=UPI00278F98E2|nr:hypothetical protein [Microbacterium sp. SORGH_AS_0862]MDQ1203797.1 hypothetical protein [Microbacterium sp. SORGH_AS_0862]
MSTTTSAAWAIEPLEQRPDTGRRQERALRPVEAPARRRRPRLVYGIIAVAGALAIAGAQMVLSVLSTQSSFELASLTQQQRDLTVQKQILYDQVAGLSSPQYLAANAAALGMVINESPSYLRLSDGAVLGAQQASVLHLDDRPAGARRRLECAHHPDSARHRAGCHDQRRAGAAGGRDRDGRGDRSGDTPRTDRRTAHPCHTLRP